MQSVPGASGQNNSMTFGGKVDDKVDERLTGLTRATLVALVGIYELLQLATTDGANNGLKLGVALLGAL